MNGPSPELVPLTADERAATRAFVARCEVRLSTLHRIAVGMLSGAGLLVVLPVDNPVKRRFDRGKIQLGLSEC